MRSRASGCSLTGPRRALTIIAIAGALALMQGSAHAHERLAEQIAQVSAQIARSSANAELLVRRAELYRAAREYQQALADLNRASVIDPTMAATDLVRAHVCLDMRDPAAAADSASRFLARRAGDADALIVRGRALAILGRGRDAAADFTRALEASPMPDLYIERARVTAHSGGKGVADALQGLDEGIGRLGPLVTLETEAIDLEIKLTRYDAALTRLERLSAQSARQESWLVRRGEILELAGRVEEARSTYRAALAAATALPDWIRRTPASSALVERLHAEIARLENAGTTRRRRPN
jgi:tetratricopeptide (TPR) repeat protein